MNNIAALILAAGRGTRMKSTTTNKVMSLISGKPMLAYSIDNILKAEIYPIIVVVGFAKESIMKYFQDQVLYAVQLKPLGTADAVSCGLTMVPSDTADILSVYGDDSYLYSPQLLKKLINKHKISRADVTMLTVDLQDPTGLGRIIRNKQGVVQGIVEEKVATGKQKKITEINTGCYIFNKEFLTDYVSRISLNPVAQEYYITDIIALAVKDKKKIEAVRGGSIPWRGVNKPDELEEARRLVNPMDL